MDYSPLHTSPRDTLVLGFDAAFANKPDAYPFDPILHDICHSLLRLAIIMTSSTVS